MKTDRHLRALSFNHTMSELVRRTGVAKTSAIHITGPGGLPLLLWFCRHGFEQASYVRQGCCAAEPSDLLIVLDSGDGDALARQSRHYSPLLVGGTLVIQTSDPRPGAGTAQVLRIYRNEFPLKKAA